MNISDRYKRIDIISMILRYIHTNYNLVNCVCLCEIESNIGWRHFNNDIKQIFENKDENTKKDAIK